MKFIFRSVSLQVLSILLLVLSVFTLGAPQPVSGLEPGSASSWAPLAYRVVTRPSTLTSILQPESRPTSHLEQSPEDQPDAPPVRMRRWQPEAASAFQVPVRIQRIAFRDARRNPPRLPHLPIPGRSPPAA